MLIEVKMLDMGIEKAEVTEILVKVGDDIQVEQSLLIVEGDKTSMEIPSPYTGKVKDIMISVGDKITMGSLLMIFEIDLEYSANNTNNHIISVNNININSNHDIQQNNNVSHILTDTIIPTPKLTLFCDQQHVQKNFIDNVHATPIIRRLARDFNINLTKVKGTGRKGRIIRSDIIEYIKKAIEYTESMSEITKKDSLSISNNQSLIDNQLILKLLTWPKENFAKFGKIEEVKFSKIQQASGSNLHRNWIMIPHVTQFDDIDITDIETFRTKKNITLKEQKCDVKITLLAFIIKSVTISLKEFPNFNSSLSIEDYKKTLKKYINIGVAVNTVHGLVVPVLRNVNKKDIIELSIELAYIIQKARNGKLMASDMHGGTFTISSLGSAGGQLFTPIINAPEVAILGISKSSIKPIWNGKEFIPRLMLPLSLSYDHRVIDGVEGVNFINYIKNTLTNINQLII